MTAFPTLEYLVQLIGLAFVDFLPIILFIPSMQVFFHVSQVSIKKRDVILSVCLRALSYRSYSSIAFILRRNGFFLIKWILSDPSLSKASKVCSLFFLFF